MKTLSGSNINKIIQQITVLLLLIYTPINIFGQIDTVSFNGDKEFLETHSYFSLPKTWVKATVWKNGKGVRIVCSIASLNYYQYEDNVVETKNKWDKIEAFFLIPKTEANQEIKLYLHNNEHSRVSFKDFNIEFLEDYKYPNFENLPVLNLILNDSNIAFIDSVQQKARNIGIIPKSEKKWMNIELKDSIGIYSAKARIKGDWLDHIDNDKMSFRIKIKDSSRVFNRVKTFSIQHPKTRNYIREWLLHKVLEDEDILTTKYDFIWLKQNGRSKGIYAFEQHFDKYLLERQNRREAPILKFEEDGFWEIIKLKTVNNNFKDKYKQEYYTLHIADIIPFKKKKTNRDSLLALQFNKAANLIDDYRNINPEVLSYFDIEKFAEWIALTDVFESYHSLNWINLRFYLNPLSGLIEPVVYDGYEDHKSKKFNSTPIIGYIDELHDTSYNLSQEIILQLFRNNDFRVQYYNNLKRYSSTQFLDEVFNKYGSKIDELTNDLKQEFRADVFNKQEYFTRANEIQMVLNTDTLNLLSESKKIEYYPLWNWIEDNPKIMPSLNDTFLFPSISLKAQYDDDELKIYNLHPQKIEVLAFYDKNDSAFYLKEPVTIKEFNPLMPVSYIAFNRNGVRKVSYKIGSVEGVIKVNNKVKIAGSKRELKIEGNYKEYFREEREALIPINNNLLIDSIIILPQNKLLKIPKGTNIHFENSGALVVQGDFRGEGTKEHPITITGENNTNGIVVNGKYVFVELNYVFCAGLGQVSTNSISTTGGITFYNSICNINNCTFENSRGEDIVNIVNSNSIIKNSTFKNALSDALDIDYGKGTIKGCFFEGALNDNIDISSATYFIENIKSINAKDKAISCGEKSRVTISKSQIENSTSGIVVKDQSDVEVLNTSIKNCEFGVKVFQKKSEYAGGKLTLTEVGFKDNMNKQFKDNQSTIIEN